MIDRPGRKQPRFPAQKEGLVKNAIRKKVLEEKNRAGAAIEMVGIAGGACGGDILFHEACSHLGVPTHIYLALPPEQFVNEWVAFAGNGWVERFYRLIDMLPYSVLLSNADIARVPNRRPDDSIHFETNLWMLDNAMAGGAQSLTIIALQDGAGDAGGLEDVLIKAKEKHARTVIISSDNLL